MLLIVYIENYQSKIINQRDCNKNLHKFLLFREFDQLALCVPIVSRGGKGIRLLYKL